MENVLAYARAVLETTPARWTALVETLPADLLARAPAPGEWSAVECLQHLLDVERHVFPKRVAHLLAGQDLPSYDPDSQAAASGAPSSPSAMAEEFARLRVDSLATLSVLTGVDLERRSRHEALGPVTLSDLVHEWAAHDLVHTIQAERALMQPFIPGTGPWRSFFAEHEIAAEVGDQG